MRRLTLRAVILLSCCAAVKGQDSGIRLPLTGFIEDSASSTIRAIRGIPGAATLSDPLAVPPLTLARVAPRRDFAIATSSGSTLLIAGLSKTVPEVRTLEGSISEISRVVFNESGSAAVLYSESKNVLQAIVGLPDNVTVSAAFAAPANVIDLALSADATFVLAACSDGVAGGVWEIMTGASNSTLVANAIAPRAVVLLNADRDFAFADSGAGQVVFVRDLASAREPFVWLSSADIQNAVALKMVNGKLWVAGGSPNRVIAYDPATQSIVADQALPLQPATLRGTNLPDLLLLNETGNGPLYVLSTSDGAVSWVPALH